MAAWWKWGVPFAIIVAGMIMISITGCSGGVSPFGIDEQTEIRIGQQAAADLESQYGVVNDPTQLARVQRIGRSIAAVSNRPNLPWTFRILNMSEINALSLPGGPVYVTRGLLQLGVTDAELEGVIAHEVAHIDLRHSVHAIQRAMTYQLLSELVLGQSSQALQTAANLAIQLAIELPNSRSNEYEADSVGIRLAYNAGYPANGLVQFLKRLEQVTGPEQTPEWLRTHPLTTDRIQRAQEIATEVSRQARPVPLELSEQNQQVLQQLIEDEQRENTDQQ